MPTPKKFEALEKLLAKVQSDPTSPIARLADPEAEAQPAPPVSPASGPTDKDMAAINPPPAAGASPMPFFPPGTTDAGVPLGNPTPEEARSLAQQAGPSGAQAMVPAANAGGSPANLISGMLANLTKPKVKSAELKSLLDAQPESLDEAHGGLSDIKKEIEKLLGKTQRMDLTPLAALTDAWTGSKFAQSYKGPPTPEEQAQLPLKLQELLQKERLGISSQDLELLKSKLTADTKLDGTNDMRGMAQMFGAMMHSGMDGTPLSKARQYGMHASDKIIDSVKHDKLGSARLGAIQNLDNVFSNAAATEQLTPQQFEDLQQTIIKNLGNTGGTGGVDERKAKFFHSLGMDSSKLWQYVTGTPQNLRRVADPKTGKMLLDSNDPATATFLKHITDQVRNESGNIKGILNNRLDAMTSGYDSILDNPENADLKDNIKGFTQKWAKQYQTPNIDSLIDLDEQQNPEFYKAKTAPAGAAQPRAPQAAQPSGSVSLSSYMAEHKVPAGNKAAIKKYLEDSGFKVGE